MSEGGGLSGYSSIAVSTSSGCVSMRGSLPTSSSSAVPCSTTILNVSATAANTAVESSAPSAVPIPSASKTNAAPLLVHFRRVKIDPDPVPEPIDDDFSVAHIYPPDTDPVYDEFTERSVHRDTEIVVGDTEKRSFFVNGHYLAEISGFFRELFAQSPRKMILQRENPNRLLLLLQVIHSQPARPLNLSKAGMLLLMSLDYKVKHLHGLCQNFIIENMERMDRRNLTYLFEALARRKRTWIFQRLFDFVVRSFSFDEIDALRIEDPILSRDLYRSRGKYESERSAQMYARSPLSDVKPNTGRKRGAAWDLDSTTESSNNKRGSSRQSTPLVGKMEANYT